VTPENWERVKEIFDAIVETTPAERLAVLDDLDVETRTAVQKLLRSHDAAANKGGLLDRSPLPGSEFWDALDRQPRVFEPMEVLADRFEVQRELGRGGMGEVYEAYDRVLRERIAIKTVRFDLSFQPAIVSRFKREVQRSRQVTHTNVCRVYDLFSLTGKDGRETPFLTMELIDGPNLSDLIRTSGPLDDAQARSLALQICAGLGAAHEAGIIHRDLKSGNILLAGKAPNRRVAITDFGLARAMTPGTQTRTMLPLGVEGTVAYLAPEVLSGGPATAKSDIYALGVVMFRMISGKYPFSENPDNVAVAVKERQRPPRLQESLPAASTWREAIQACLEPLPEDRPESPASVAQLVTGEDRRSRLKALRRWARSVPRRDFVIGGIAAATVAGISKLVPLWQGAQLKKGAKLLVEEFTSPSGHELGRTVRNLFRLSLTQSRQVVLVKQEEVGKALERLGIGVAPIRGELARSIAQSTGAQATLGGEASQAGNGYSLLAEIRDPSGHKLSSVRESVPDARDLPALVQKAAGRLGLLDANQLADMQIGSTPLEQLDSVRPDALEMLTAGLEHIQNGERGAAMEFLREATRIDPQFAMAWLNLATMQMAFGRDDLALGPAERAYALRERVSGRQRIHAEAIYFLTCGDWDRALERWRVLVSMYPNDPALHRHIAQAYALDLRPEDELQHAKQAVLLDSDDAGARMILIEAYADNGRYSDSEQSLRETDRLMPGKPILALSRGYCNLVQSNIEGALDWYGQAARSQDLNGVARSYQLRALLLGGRLEEARSQLESDLAVLNEKGDPENESDYRHWLGQLLAITGEDRLAAEQASVLAAEEAVPMNLSSFRAAAEIAAACRADQPLTEALTKVRAIAASHPSTRSKSYAAQCEGLLAGLRRQASDALRLLQSAQSIRFDLSNAWALGEALRAKGAVAESLAQYQRIVVAKWMALRFEYVLIWVQSVAAAGLAKKALGQYSQAVADFDLFLRHWGSQRQLQLVRNVMEAREETLRRPA